MIRTAHDRPYLDDILYYIFLGNTYQGGWRPGTPIPTLAGSILKKKYVPSVKNGLYRVLLK